jgi:hypothetical protein
MSRLRVAAAMHSPDFLRIERDEADSSRHFVVHAHEPGFFMELAPDAAAPDRIGAGVIKRVHIPNSWCGGYQNYFKLMSEAQAFFSASFGNPAPKEWTQRIRI